MHRVQDERADSSHTQADSALRTVLSRQVSAAAAAVLTSAACPATAAITLAAHVCGPPPLLLQVTEAQQQWWGFKADNFDSVLLFKVGKFYEVREGEGDSTARQDTSGQQIARQDTARSKTAACTPAHLH
jgi:hypothetical protein